MRPYVIRQGEYLRALAFKAGFDAEAVWAVGQNDGLCERRASHDILCPGDVLNIPDATSGGGLSIECGASNSFTCVVPRVEVALKVMTHLQGRSLRYTVRGCGGATPGMTDADGTARFAVPVDVTWVHVELHDLAARLAVHVGGPDPSTERSGQMQRMRNLGIVSRDPAREGGEASAEVAVASGMREFRRRLAIGDVSDDDARKRLEDAHGG